MREDRIKSGIGFLQKVQDLNISLDEKKKFLEAKMTEDEIAETFKRYADMQ